VLDDRESGAALMVSFQRTQLGQTLTSGPPTSSEKEQKAMTDQDPELNLIVQRLGTLERSNRVLKYLIAIGCAAFCLVLGSLDRESMPQKAKSVRSSRHKNSG